MTKEPLNFTAWNVATSNLPWGVQSVFLETLKAVRDHGTNLAYGADYVEGSPCLVNATAVMLSSIKGEGGKNKPATHFEEMVIAFDNICRDMYGKGIGEREQIVSPLMAEFLIHNFGTLKDRPLESSVNEATANEAFASNIYFEPSDEDLMRDWLNAMSEECEVIETEKPAAHEQVK